MAGNRCELVAVAAVARGDPAGKQPAGVPPGVDGPPSSTQGPWRRPQPSHFVSPLVLPDPTLRACLLLHLYLPPSLLQPIPLTLNPEP